MTIELKNGSKSALPLLCNRGRRFIAGGRFEPTTLLSKSLDNTADSVVVAKIFNSELRMHFFRAMSG